MSLAKDDSVKKAVNYPFKYVLTENGSKKSSSKSSSKSTEAAGAGKTTSTDSSAETDEKKQMEKEFTDAIRDLKLQVLLFYAGRNPQLAET